MQQLDDAQLLSLIARGHAWAFERLLRRYQQPMMRFLYALTADRALAEDLFQETFVVIVRGAASYRPTGSARRWIYTIARNKALNSLRRPGVVLLHPDAVARLPDRRSPGPGDCMADAELRRAFESAMQELPPLVRACFVLQRFDGRSHPEVAELLEMPVGTVKSNVRRAREHLRRRLSRFIR
jgi:RNA polymerase sigma-70 factor (ECF subfamily)